MPWWKNEKLCQVFVRHTVTFCSKYKTSQHTCWYTSWSSFQLTLCTQTLRGESANHLMDHSWKGWFQFLLHCFRFSTCLLQSQNRYVHLHWWLLTFFHSQADPKAQFTHGIIRHCCYLEILFAYWDHIFNARCAVWTQNAICHEQ